MRLESKVHSSKLITTVLGVASVCCLFACSDNTTIVSNVDFGDPVRVSGEVRAWRCGIRDGWNNNGDLRFGVATKDTATIIISYPNGWKDTAYTDTLSRFERVVSKGLHQLIVETRYSWPDTFQIYFDQDTVVNLDIVYDVLDASRVGVTFPYPIPSETLSVKQEWEILKRLNSKLQYKLSVPPEVPQDVDRSSRRLEYMAYRIVSYRIPVASRRIHTLDVWREGSNILAADSSHAISPTPMYIEPPYYLCMAQ